MNYFSISFSYNGTYSNFGSAKVDQYLMIAIEEVERILNQLKVKNLNQYSWTDGSLYRFARTSMERGELLSSIQKIETDKVKVLGVVQLNEDYNPHKYRCKTLKQYFDRESYRDE